MGLVTMVVSLVGFWNGNGVAHPLCFVERDWLEIDSGGLAPGMGGFREPDADWGGKKIPGVATWASTGALTSTL